MGADLITTIVAKPVGTELDWDAGYAAINTLTEDDVDLAYLENFMYDLEVDEDDNVNMEQVHERVKDALDDLKFSASGFDRYRNDWKMFGHDVYIFGEVSYGDVTEIFDSVGILYAAPKVLEAAGFVTEFSEVTA